jgi:hypothetical protein
MARSRPEIGNTHDPLVLSSGADSFSPPPETFYLAYRGSIAHGMYVPPEDRDSIDDIDLMGFVFGEPRHYFGLHEWASRGTKEVKAGRYDVVLYEIRKAFSLLLRGNPNIMLMLWIKPEHRLLFDDAARELVENRQLFVGKHVYDAFAGYAHEQLTKMETRDPDELRQYIAVTAELKFCGIHPNHKDERFAEPDRGTGEGRDVAAWSDEKLLQRMARFHKKGENLGYLGDKRKKLVLRHGYDSKNAAHLVRLLRMCVEFMKTGELTVMRPDATELLDIKAGKWTLEKIKSHAQDLFAEAQRAWELSQLPAEPDYQAVERLLIRLIRQRIVGS